MMDLVALVNLMSAEDAMLMLQTAAVLHLVSHGPMSARHLELAAQPKRMEKSCATVIGTQKLTLNSTACLIWEP